MAKYKTKAGFDLRNRRKIDMWETLNVLASVAAMVIGTILVLALIAAYAQGYRLSDIGQPFAHSVADARSKLGLHDDDIRREEKDLTDLRSLPQSATRDEKIEKAERMLEYYREGNAKFEKSYAFWIASREEANRQRREERRAK